jgi:HEAT repeat protein
VGQRGRTGLRLDSLLHAQAFSLGPAQNDVAENWFDLDPVAASPERLKDVPTLLPLVQHKEVLVRHKAIVVLAQLKDVRGIEPIAPMLARLNPILGVEAASSRRIPQVQAF